MKFVRFIYCTISVLCITLFLCSCTRMQTEEKNLFISCQEDFELINQFILETSNGRDGISFSLVTQDTNGNSEIVSLFMHHPENSKESKNILLSDEMKNAFNTIWDTLFRMDFSFIDVTEDRISYGGLGSRMYVYSRNGERPTYFYSPSDDVVYHTYHLENRWYLLANIAR